MKQLFQKPIVVLLLFLAIACKQEYTPKLTSSNQSVLIVEGVLNSTGLTTIKLSRSLKLEDSTGLQPESGAQVIVESKSGSVQSLFEANGLGTYQADQLTLEPTDTYCLHIQTGDGREYASDFVHVLNNPPIDSINWRRDDKGVRLFVSTHDPENNTQYYRWGYDETWELRSAFEAKWKLVGTTPVRRDSSEQVYHCWRYHTSSEILLGTTTQLSSDVVFQKPLIFIPANTEPLAVRYSILVHQYALDKEGYTFYELLKKNTESLGSIFDAQPSDLNGNVHGITDPNELVVGYITAAPVQEKRIFISNAELPYWLYSNSLCQDKIFVANNPDSFKKYYNGYYEPYAEEELTHSGYYSAYGLCVDCTLRGGVNTKPAFW